MRPLALAALLLATPAFAHTMSEHGTILLPYPERVTGPYVPRDPFLFDPPGPVIPQGLQYYVMRGVEGGDDFTVKSDDGGEPILPCDPMDCCPPEPDDPFGPLRCGHGPDFDLTFTGGPHENGPGDEAGVVPGSGDAVVWLFFGDVGEGFTYSES